MSHSKRLLERLPKHKMVLDARSFNMAHPIYKMTDIEQIPVTHRKPEKFRDLFALNLIRFMRTGFDIVTGYNEQKMTPSQWLNRAIFLETVAGVPGMVGGMTRHLKSLRTLQPDQGWIHNLLEEAENERTHLFIFLKLKQPSTFFKIMIAAAQGIFYNLYFISYLLAPKYCHRFVGYLEEEAVHTYTVLLKQIDNGYLPEWAEMPAPQMAREYYNLPEDAKFRDVILSIRADESIHREVNHFVTDQEVEQPIETEEIIILNKEMNNEIPQLQLNQQHKLVSELSK